MYKACMNYKKVTKYYILILFFKITPDRFSRAKVRVRGEREGCDLVLCAGLC
jgi:hypothetical protein